MEALVAASGPEVLVVGLGPMGMGYGHRLSMSGQHKVYGYDKVIANGEASANEMRETATKKGITPITDYSEVRKIFSGLRQKIILAVPENAVDDVLNGLTPHLRKFAIIMDCTNSDYKDTGRRAAYFAEGFVSYIGIGVSGGVDGEKDGYCLMYRTSPGDAPFVDPIMKELAWGHEVQQL
jgi:6-phosphogluconate dehydrogenase